MTIWHERRVGGIDVDIHVEHTELPAGAPAVVLAHGFSDNGRCWGRVAAALAERFAVVLVDSRNHGRSGAAVGDVEAQAADLGAVITDLGLDHPHVVGHSMGAAAAAVLAAQRPELIGRVVLLDPPWTGDGHPDPESARERVERLSSWVAHVRSLDHDGLVALAAEQHPDWHPDDLAPWYESKRQLRTEAGSSLGVPPWPETVADISSTTLLLRGETERGGIVTEALAAEVVDVNPLVESQLIAGTGHNLHREDLDATLAAVLEFLER